MSRYPWHLLPQLATRIESHQVEAAHEDLDGLLVIIGAHSSPNLALRKLRCAQLITISLRGALHGGAESEALLQGHIEVLEKLAAARTWKVVQLLMHNYVDELLAHVRPQRHTNVERLVAWMKEDMRDSLKEPKTLTQYARSGDVSVAHLSRCFASLRGCTFREELKRLRMEKAKQLLEETNLKITAVASQVGLRDTARFILEFRRETGETPNAYRQIHRKN